jgi:hypothetical protein
MGRWAQPSITLLNAYAPADRRRSAKRCGEKRCLFPALNQAACEVEVLPDLLARPAI